MSGCNKADGMSGFVGLDLGKNERWNKVGLVESYKYVRMDKITVVQMYQETFNER